MASIAAEEGVEEVQSLMFYWPLTLLVPGSVVHFVYNLRGRAARDG